MAVTEALPLSGVVNSAVWWRLMRQGDKRGGEIQIRPHHVPSIGCMECRQSADPWRELYPDPQRNGGGNAQTMAQEGPVAQELWPKRWHLLMQLRGNIDLYRLWFGLRLEPKDIAKQHLILQSGNHYAEVHLRLSSAIKALQ